MTKHHDFQDLRFSVKGLDGVFKDAGTFIELSVRDGQGGC